MPPKTAVRQKNEPLPAFFYCQHCLRCSYFGFEREASGIATKRPCPVCGSNNVFVPKTRDQLVHAYESAAINQSRKPSMTILRSLIDLHVRTGGKVVMFRGGVLSDAPRTSSATTSTAGPAPAARTSTTTNTNNSNNAVRRLSEGDGANGARRTSTSSSGVFSAQPPPLPATFSATNRDQQHRQQQQQQQGHTLTASSSAASLGASQRSQSSSFNAQPPPQPTPYNLATRETNQPGRLPTFQEPTVPAVVTATRTRYSSSREGSREPSRQSSISITTPTVAPPRRQSQPQQPPPRPPTGGTRAPATTTTEAPRRTITVPRAANTTNISPPANATAKAPPRRRTPDEVIAAQKLFRTGLNGTQVRTGQDTVCAVCFDECLWSKEEVVQLGCKHFYHMDCIRPWIDGFNFNCPMCRHAL